MKEKSKGHGYGQPGTASEKSTGQLDELTGEGSIPGVRTNTVKKHQPQDGDAGIASQVSFRDRVHKAYPKRHK